jgi:hypothetical protein
MIAPAGTTWVGSALKYVIVGVVFSISTFCLSSNNNGGFWTRVVDSSVVTLARSDLGRALQGEPGKDSAAEVEMSSLEGGQDGLPAHSSAAENAAVLSSIDFSVGLMMPYLCRWTAGILYGWTVRPLPQILLHLPKRLGSGTLAVLFLEIQNGK